MKINILIEAKKNIEAGWTTGAYARDDDGESFTNGWGNGGSSFYADNSGNVPTCWCMLGALEKSSGISVCDTNKDFEEISKSLLDSINELYPHYELKGKNSLYPSIPSFNDDEKTTKEMVLKVFDHTIEKAKKIST